MLVRGHRAAFKGIRDCDDEPLRIKRSTVACALATAFTLIANGWKMGDGEEHLKGALEGCSGTIRKSSSGKAPPGTIPVSPHG